MTAGANAPSLKGDIVFTGRLASMKRATAVQAAREHGATPRRGVTKRTRFLVVGQLGWPLLSDGKPSNSLSRAQAYGVAIVSERRFLEWIGRAGSDDEARSFTIEQIATLASLPAEIVELLAAFGVLDPRNGLFRFRDLAAARQVAELLSAGVKLSAITTNLAEIQKWLPDAGLSKIRLYPASRDAVLVEHFQGRTDHKGQFVLPIVSQDDEDADVIFEQAQAAEEAEDLAVAERLYRRVIAIDKDDPTAAFNLGNLLRSAGRRIDAEAAFRLAIKADPTYVDAWYNLADLQDEKGETEKAISTLRRSLRVDPKHGDSLFNIALLLQRQGAVKEAIGYWNRYLQLDQTSDWAAKARKALKLCEMQIARSG